MPAAPDEPARVVCSGMAFRMVTGGVSCEVLQPAELLDGPDASVGASDVADANDVEGAVRDVGPVRG